MQISRNYNCYEKPELGKQRDDVVVGKFGLGILNERGGKWVKCCTVNRAGSSLHMVSRAHKTYTKMEKPRTRNEKINK